MFESMEMDWLCLESAIAGIETNFDSDYNLQYAEEGVLSSAAAFGVGYTAGTAAGNTIVGGINKAHHKKDTKDIQITDADWNHYEKSIKLSQKVLRDGLDDCIRDSFSSRNVKDIDKVVSNWRKSFTIITSYDTSKVRQQKMCPLVKIPVSALTFSDYNMNRILDALIKKVNTALSEHKLPGKAIQTNWGGGANRTTAWWKECPS